MLKTMGHQATDEMLHKMIKVGFGEDGEDGGDGEDGEDGEDGGI